MLVNLFLSNSALGRILKLRLLGEFRPIDEPIMFKNQPCYMDGFQIDYLTLAKSPRMVNFAVNNLNDANSQVVPVTQPFTIHPVLVSVGGAVLMTTEEMLRAARTVQGDERYGLPDRPEDLQIPIFGVEFDLFISVAPNGAPILHFELQKIPEIELSDDVQNFLDMFRSLTVPFAVGDAFNDFLFPNQTRVLNGGISSLDDGVAMRLEYEMVESGAASNIHRMSEWTAFFNGQTPSPLNGRDWAFDLPTEALALTVGKVVDDQFNSSDVREFFTSTRAASVEFFPGYQLHAVLPAPSPGFNITKDGVLDGRCAGLDIRAQVTAMVEFSIPKPNNLRISGSVDIDLNDWDSAKCIGISLINPFAGLETTLKYDAPWWAFLPISILLPLAPIAFGFGGDDIIVNFAIKEAQTKAKQSQPTIVRTSQTTFYTDVEKQIVTALTRDWMVIQEVRGYGKRLVLAGDFTAPDLSTLPRIRGYLSDGFNGWSRKNRCSTDVKWLTVATLALELEDAATGERVYPSPVPVRYGIDIENINGKKEEVGQVTWRIIDDEQGVYRGRKTRVHWDTWPSEVFEIIVEDPDEPYASNPYPFRFQFFTSMGVREFEIPAPPPMPKPPVTREEQINAAAERISRCYIFSSLISRIKALQVLWLPRPQPVAEVGQHWQVLVHGLKADDRLIAWDVDRREVLAEVRPYSSGLAEISLVTAHGQSMRALQLTLNDAPFLEETVYHKQAASVTGQQETGPNPVYIRQGPLYLAARIALDNAAEVIEAVAEPNVLHLIVDGLNGPSQIKLDLLNSSFQLRYSQTANAQRPLEQLPSRLHKLQRSSSRGRMVTEIVSPGISKQDSVITRYYARSRYDRGSLAGRYFVQLTDTGTHINVYLTGAMLETEPDLGNRSV